MKIILAALASCAFGLFLGLVIQSDFHLLSQQPAQYDDYEKLLNAGQCGASGNCGFNVYDSSGKLLNDEEFSMTGHGAIFLLSSHGGHNDFYTEWVGYDPERGMFKTSTNNYIFDSKTKKYKLTSNKLSWSDPE